MVAKRCYRTLDRPITVFGLEIEDLLAVVAAAGALLVLAGPFAGIAAGLGGWTLLRRLKAGKPPGYFYTLAYKSGVPAVFPLLAVPHLVRKAPRQKRIRFSAVRSDAGADSSDPVERFYWEGIR